MKFNNSGRYTVPSDEGFEPDSNGEVLRNFLGIKSREEIEIIEAQQLKRTELELLNIFDQSHRFTANDICNIHELWLGDVYPSAGKYRSVTMSKDDFLFAAPQRIEASMRDFEIKYLAKYTPCNYSDINELSYALGLVHVELILIHPFREGNGRTARLLADLMAIQANRPSLNYMPIGQTINQEGFDRYIRAIHAGVNGDYNEIQKIFLTLLDQSL
jgi:cell filamentation protein